MPSLNDTRDNNSLIFKFIQNIEISLTEQEKEGYILEGMTLESTSTLHNVIHETVNVMTSPDDQLEFNGSGEV